MPEELLKGGGQRNEIDDKTGKRISIKAAAAVIWSTCKLM